MCYTGVEFYSLNATRSGVAAFQILLFFFNDFIGGKKKGERKKKGNCLVQNQRRGIIIIPALPIPVLWR